MSFFLLLLLILDIFSRHPDRLRTIFYRSLSSTKTIIIIYVFSFGFLSFLRHE